VRRLGNSVEAEESESMLTAIVDAAVGGDPPQPERYMIGRLEAAKMMMQLKKDLLREVLRGRPVLEVVIGDAEHHRLMTCDQDVEVERIDGRGLDGACVGSECGSHPSWDIYEKDGAPGCSGLLFFGVDARFRTHAGDLQQARLVLCA